MSGEKQGALLLKKQLAGMFFLKDKLLSFVRPSFYALLIRWRRFAFSTDLNKNGAEGFSAGLIDDENLFKWELMIVGPPETF